MSDERDPEVDVPNAAPRPRKLPSARVQFILDWLWQRGIERGLFRHDDATVKQGAEESGDQHE